MQKFNLSMIAVTGFITASLCLAGCSHDLQDDEPLPLDTPKAEEAKTAYDSVYNSQYRLYIVKNDTTPYPKISSNATLTNAEKQIGNKLTEYAVKMLMDYDLGNDQNVAFSPMSATAVYAMMSGLVDDESKQNEYMKEIGLESATESNLSSYQRKIYEIAKDNDGLTDAETGFSIENNMLMKAGQTVYKSFLSTADAYKVKVKGTDFSNMQEMSVLNSNIKSKVGESNVGIGSLTSGNTMSLVSSALAFKQLWKKEFAVDSVSSVFTSDNGTTYARKMLTRKGKEQFNFFSTFSMLELPYKGDKYSMFVVLPNKQKTLAQALAELSKAGLNHCTQITSDTTRSYHGRYYSHRTGKTGLLKYVDGVLVDTVYVTDTIIVDTLDTDTLLKIRMPEFKYSGTAALNTNNKMNSAKEKMFSMNLGKVSPNGFTLGNIYQSCCLEVTRYGTKATVKAEADVTAPHVWTGGGNPYIGGGTGITIEPIRIGVTYERFAPPAGKRTHEDIVEDFFVNRPFMVFIKENKTGAVLFSACIRTLN